MPAARLLALLALLFPLLTLTPEVQAQTGTPSAAGADDAATDPEPEPEPAIASVPEALAAVNTVDSEPTLLRLAVRPLFRSQLEEALPAWLDHVQALAAAGEPVGPAVERTRILLDAIEARGGDIAETDQYLNAVSGTILSMESVDPTDVVGIAGRIQDWIVSPDGGVALGLNILFFLAIIVLARLASNLVSGIVRRALKKVGKGSELLRDFLANISGQAIFLIGIVVAIGRLGVDTGPLLAAIGAAGFVIGFALQGTLGNFAAGVMILLYRPYDIGDVVTAGGVTGKVQAMTLVSTTMLTPDNQTIIVPNGTIWGDTITNVTGNDTRRVDLVFGIGYDDDVEAAEKVLMEVVTAHPKVLSTPEPQIKLHELADSSVNFVVRPWTRTADYWDVYFDLHREMKLRFDAEGIGIPYPQMDLHVRQVT